MNTPESLILKLCQCLCESSDPDAAKRAAQSSLRMLSYCGQHAVPNIDETSLIEKMKLQMTKTGRTDDAVKLTVLHRRLKQSQFLQNRWSILYLLHALSSKKEHKFGGGNLLFRQGLACASTPLANTTPGQISQQSLTSSSGFGTAAAPSSRGGYESMSQLPSEIRTPGDITRSDYPSTNLSSRLAWTKTPSTHLGNSETSRLQMSSISQVPLQNISNRTGRSQTRQSQNSKEKISEITLVRQLLYIFQGIETKNIKHSTRENAFCLSNDVDVDKHDRQIVHRLAELGWLHNHIKKYIDSHNKDKAFGLVGQAFCAALQQELTEYYRLLSVLQSQIQQVDAGFEDDSALTLSKLVVWTYEPLERLRLIAALVDICQGKKGGALASVVYSYMQTGDDNAQSITKRVLQIVSQPIFHIIDRWIHDGELHDPFHEFFVAADLNVGNERLWYDKYRMRPQMVPSFVKTEQAQKILLVGKSINFLRLVCRDRTAIRIREDKSKAEGDRRHEGYGLDFASDLKLRVDEAYEATSRHLLAVLNDRYKMLTHLHALRKFLLLGQGDFIRHLLDLLQDELAKPASTLYRHNLSGPVEAAVRASNAQFEDSDVLARLDFRLLEINPGDCGWDVFSLDYHVDPPLNTLITPDVMLVYLRIFIFLWRAKRMEYQLALIWTNTMDQTRKLAHNLIHLKGVLHHCHTLAAEMVHFVHQMQYYIAFEVLECSWADLQLKLEEAKDFDEVIGAHHSFLESLMKRCLLDASSSHLLMQLRTIFDQIVKFESLQKDIYEQSSSELRQRQLYEKELDDAEKKGVWGADTEKEEEEMRRRREFKKITIPEMRARLTVCTCAYQDMVVMFLRQLDTENDSNLRNLSWRLDFNEHYRSRNTALQLVKPGGGKKR